ncbi:MAG TPA: amidohydrolase [Caldithrix abyssi]|uniref:Amidohydrolase n=1 Tax=Caldithrix abyssi TaxID=187145 RepID=A0A7V4U3G1_CALAY|nr:amidohydrolase [Caldithrix abyssi]
MQERLFYNGNIYNLQTKKVFDWLLIKNGFIVALGLKDQRPSLSYNRSGIDLHGLTVLPAFIDAHTHLTIAALEHRRVQFKNCLSLEQALQRLHEYAPTVKEDAWVQGGGFNKNNWQDGVPHRTHLDQIFPQNPVALFSVDMHSLWVNTKALKISGLFKNKQTIHSGRIERDEDGLPNGLLYEDAMKPVLDKIPPTNAKEAEEAIQDYSSYLFKLGITAVHTMEAYDDFHLLQRLKKQDRRLRTTVYLYHQRLKEIIKDKQYSYAGDEWLRLGGIKLFLDGSLGSRTAHLFGAYEDNSQNYGVEVLTIQELDEILQEAAENRLAPAVHAIGDRAVHKVIKVFGTLKDTFTGYNLVPRIEHVQLIRQEDIPLLAQTGAVASVQPVHIAVDVKMAEKYWGSRSVNAYALKALVKAGVTLAAGSDAPVADPDPLKGIFSAVQRRYAFDTTEPVWQPQSRLNIWQAIRSYTEGSARAAGEGHRRGRLEAGYQADFIALSPDPFKINSENLLETEVIMTVQDGKIVYGMESKHLY